MIRRARWWCMSLYTPCPQARQRTSGRAWGAHASAFWVYLATDLVPSDTACIASSPGNNSLIAVSTSRFVNVLRFVVRSKRVDSVAILSKMSFMKLFMMFIARLLIPQSGWICLKTLKM
eukprot:CAMPEP_0117489412 /NCGR_PEP_ID=MMETSP0784-20121206/17020_1 /TAXON_ID=39447 /ORGANISM="" /LENGTH=118 /DNA_ID=CAMNT_0005284135 /DNA_START=20 /DNA_END=376 /DNA_ORIENTATION=-